MTERTRPQLGQIYSSPIYLIGASLPDINVPNLGIKIENRAVAQLGDEVFPFMCLVATEAEQSWELLYLKMGLFTTGLAISNVTHTWLADVIYDDGGHQVWSKPNSVLLITDKEGDPNEILSTHPGQAVAMVDVTTHISRFYPRVFLYHYVGLLLLRTPIVGFNLNAEVLLNFFKIAELITRLRTNAKPTFKRMLATSEDLGLDYDDAVIREFCKVRSRDAAHDFQQAQAVERELAVDCKLWAEQLIINDMVKFGFQVNWRVKAD